MDLDLPEYMLDMERAHKDMVFGRFPLEIVKAHGTVSKVIGTTSNQVKFKEDNSALIYIVDLVKSNKDPGTLTFSVIRNGEGRVSQVNVMKTVEKNYPI